MTIATWVCKFHTCMARSTLKLAINRHLARMGTDIDGYLTKGIEAGRGFEELALELERIVQFPISSRTLRRWWDDLAEVAS